MYWRTCQNCIHKGACTRQNKIRDAIAGLGITSLKFCCPERALPYQPGDPVLVETVADRADAWQDDGSMAWDTFPGHFIEENKTKAQVWIKPGTEGVSEGLEFSGSGFCKIPFARISLNDDGKKIEVCSACGERNPECKRDSWDCPFKYRPKK